jgi:hypothetical protein
LNAGAEVEGPKFFYLEPGFAAALTMRAETSAGLASMATWLDETVMVVDFILAASAFSSSGGIARSLAAMTNQVGLVFQAAVVTLPCSAAMLVGPWVAKSSFFSAGDKS